MERKILNATVTAVRRRLEEIQRKNSSLPEERNSGVVKIFEDLEGIIQDLQQVSDELFLREDSVEQRSSFPELNPNPVVEVDLTGHVYYQNPAAQKLFPDLRQAGSGHPWLQGLKTLREIFAQEKNFSTSAMCKWVTCGFNSPVTLSWTERGSGSMDWISRNA
jgi:hypothetical protein